jgi:DNA anti-recombination protein RmuC
METMYFVLGMLSIIGVIAIATIVWGIVKISKLLKVIKQQEEWIINNERQIHDTLYRLREDLERRMDIMERHANGYVTDLQREMAQKLEGLERDVTDHADHLHLRIDSQITDAVTQSTSYTDRRIDKLIDTYFDIVSAKKQVIKG